MGVCSEKKTVMEFEVEGARPRGRPKENLERDCGKTPIIHIN